MSLRTSRTEKLQLKEQIINIYPYKTIITDRNVVAEGFGRNPRESQHDAKVKWRKIEKKLTKIS